MDAKVDLPVSRASRPGGWAHAARATLGALLDAVADTLKPLSARAAAHGLGGRQHVAVMEPDGIALHGLHKGKLSPATRLSGGEAAPAAYRSGRLQVRLPEEQFLKRTLRLPDTGRAYLRPIIEHRLERLTPWRPDRVLYAFDVPDGVAEDGTIAVEILATSADLVAPHLARLEGAGLKATALGSAADPLDAPLRFDLYKGRPDGGDGRLRARVGRSAAILYAVLIPTCLASFALAVVAESNLRDVEARLSALRSRIGQREGAGTPRDRGLIEAKRPEAAMIVLIDKVSRALPDGTVLRDLDIEGGKIRLVGRSTDATALIARLETEAGLKDVRFAAPVLRDAEKRDAFDIVAARAVPAGRAP